MLYANVCLLLFKQYSTVHEDYVSKAIDAFQITCSCLLDTLKRNTRFPLLLFLCTEQFTDTNLFTFFFLQDRAALNMQNVHSLYYLLFNLFPLSVPTYCILIRVGYRSVFFNTGAKSILLKQYQ